jgi:hypothetical protein
MAIEFRMVLQDRPGTLARLGAVLGDARVNIEAIQGTSRAGEGFIQFVANDPTRPPMPLTQPGSRTRGAKY